jgi:hypothetical protein
MTDQPDLFERTTDAQFERMIHSPKGRMIAKEFIKYAMMMKRAGATKYGAKGIIERVRWHFRLLHKGTDPYKINNNWTSRLARFAEDRRPELVGFFEKRKLRS